MAKVTVVMDFWCEDFDEADDLSRLEMVEAFLEYGADSTNSQVNTYSIEVPNK